MLTCTEIFQAAFQLAPMAFVIGTLQSFYSSFSELVLPVSLCSKLFFRISITRVSNHKKVVENTAAQPAPCKPIPTCGDCWKKMKVLNLQNSIKFHQKLNLKGKQIFLAKGLKKARANETKSKGKPHVCAWTHVH